MISARHPDPYSEVCLVLNQGNHLRFYNLSSQSFQHLLSSIACTIHQSIAIMSTKFLRWTEWDDGEMKILLAHLLVFTSTTMVFYDMRNCWGGIWPSSVHAERKVKKNLKTYVFSIQYLFTQWTVKISTVMNGSGFKQYTNHSISLLFITWALYITLKAAGWLLLCPFDFKCVLILH